MRAGKQKADYETRLLRGVDCSLVIALLFVDVD